ncbi:MAG: hypothetical protein OK456_03945 [Thaumarchaeota archaeon]|nr:hypothetical protein [Nitrososphaerota archaeon]
MKRSPAFSTYVAALVLIVIAMSLSFVVYQGVRSFAPEKQDQDVTFVNRVVTLPNQGGELLLVLVNASELVTPAALEVQGQSSEGGVLYLGQSGSYGSLGASLCLSGGTTFFSVHSNASGLLQVQSNGQSWIDGHLVSSLSVSSGWNEVMITNATSCSVVTPDGSVIFGPGSEVSGFPVTGTLPASSLNFYVPSDGSGTDSQILLVFAGGGVDQID